jgi:hypothetical protein
LALAEGGVAIRLSARHGQPVLDTFHGAAPVALGLRRHRPPLRSNVFPARVDAAIPCIRANYGLGGYFALFPSFAYAVGT